MSLYCYNCYPATYDFPSYNIIRTRVLHNIITLSRVVVRQKKSRVKKSPGALRTHKYTFYSIVIIITVRYSHSASAGLDKTCVRCIIRIRVQIGMHYDLWAKVRQDHIFRFIGRGFKRGPCTHIAAMSLSLYLLNSSPAPRGRHTVLPYTRTH